MGINGINGSQSSAPPPKFQHIVFGRFWDPFSFIIFIMFIIAAPGKSDGRVPHATDRARAIYFLLYLLSAHVDFNVVSGTAPNRLRDPACASLVEHAAYVGKYKNIMFYKGSGHVRPCDFPARFARRNVGAYTYHVCVIIFIIGGATDSGLPACQPRIASNHHLFLLFLLFLLWYWH